MCGIGADDEGFLPELVQQRPAALDVGRGAGGDDEELAGFGGVRIAEHRRCDVALSTPGVRSRHL